jgi:hypothetical protein
MSFWVPRKTTPHYKARPAKWVWSEVIRSRPVSYYHSQRPLLPSSLHCTIYVTDRGFRTSGKTANTTKTVFKYAGISMLYKTYFHAFMLASSCALFKKKQTSWKML